MIRLSFLYNRETINFAIQDKIIKYTDRKWKKWIQCVPRDDNFIREVIMSRGRYPHYLIKLFDLSAKDIEEYENAKTDEELAEIIIKEIKFKFKGSKLIINEKV